MGAVSITDFRANIAKMLDKVADDHEPLIVTRTGKRNAVVISEEDWEGMKETVYLLSSPNNAKRLLEAVAEINAGQVEAHDLIKE